MNALLNEKNGDNYAWWITLYANKYICRTCAPCAISGAPKKKILLFFFFWRFANFFLSLIYCTRVSLHLLFSHSLLAPTHTHTQTHASYTRSEPTQCTVRHPNGIILSLRIHIMYTYHYRYNNNIIYLVDDDEVLVWVYIILHRTFQITRTRRKLCNRRGAWVAAAYPLYGAHSTVQDIGYTRKHMVGISYYIHNNHIIIIVIV
jgi:hypothetical protein